MELKISKLEVLHKLSVIGAHKITCIDVNSGERMFADVLVHNAGLTAVFNGKAYHMCKETYDNMLCDDIDHLKESLVGVVKSFESCRGLYFVEL